MNIIQILPGKIWGGAEQYIIDLGGALRKKGENVFYISRKSEAVRERLAGEYDFVEMNFRMSYDPIAIYRLVKEIKRINPDVIHIHDTMFVPITVIAVLLSKKNTRVILTRHIARRSRTSWISRWLFRRLYKIIFVSDLAKKLWGETNKWMPNKQCVVVHNSIPETDNITCGNLREELGIKDTTTIIAYSGRVRKSKGCAILIEALGNMKDKDFAMVFIGACKPVNYNDKLMQLAKLYGICEKIYFYGFTNDARKLIEQSDIGVAPSIVREACPLSPMEFMQCGKCVITTDNGAQPEYIEHRKTGILVHPSNVPVLSEYIEMMLDNPSLRNEIGNNAAVYFKKYLAYDIFIRSIMNIYADVE